MFSLYHQKTCPYCTRVFRAIEALNLKEGKDFISCTISYGNEAYEDLLSLGGKIQVPFMVDGDIKMYESDLIIAYLQKKYRSC